MFKFDAVALDTAAPIAGMGGRVSTFPWGHTRTEKIKEIAAKQFQDVNSRVSVEDNASCA